MLHPLCYMIITCCAFCIKLYDIKLCDAVHFSALPIIIQKFSETSKTYDRERQFFS